MFDESFNDGFESLRKDFAVKLKDKLAELISIEKKLVETDFNFETLQELYKTTHSISGSCGMFGFAQISEVAYKLEEGLKLIIKGNNVIDNEIKNQLSTFLTGLIKEMETAL